MSIKPSELLPSVHAYLSTRYPKAAKALQKEALLAAPARDAVVPLEAAAAAWSRRQARRGLDGAADLPRAVHSFLADCKLERAAKALRKEGRLRGAASPAAPLLEMARLHARRAARGGAQIRLRATPRAVWAHPTHWLLRTQEEVVNNDFRWYFPCDFYRTYNWNVCFGRSSILTLRNSKGTDVERVCCPLGFTWRFDSNPFRNNQWGKCCSK